MELDYSQRRVIKLMYQAYIAGYIKNSKVYPCDIVHSIADGEFLKWINFEGIEINSNQLTVLLNEFKKTKQ